MTDRTSTVIRHELTPRLLAVLRVRRPTPRLVRFTLGGPEVAGFAHAGRPVRRHLRERGLPKGWVDVGGCWRRGAANHDHHAPIDGDEPA